MKPCDPGPDVMRPLTDAERGELLTGRCATCGVTIRPRGQRCACEPEPTVPWEVHTVTTASGGLCAVHLEGTNHYTGERFYWGLSYHGLVWSHRERFGRFKGARFGPGAREALANLLRLARGDQRRHRR